MELVFDALSDPTRRSLLDRLRESGPMSLSELTAQLPMSRQAVTKHLDRLEGAGLISVRRRGRERLHEVDPMPLRAVDDWLAPYARAWDERLAALQRHLDASELDEFEGGPTMTGTTMEKLAAIERTLELKQSPERVWRAITDPSELSSGSPTRRRSTCARWRGLVHLDGGPLPHPRRDSRPTALPRVAVGLGAR